VVMIGSRKRKSECITAVMVLPAAHVGIGNASAAASAIADAIVERFQREMWDIRSLLT
jgi:hypothetical protein